MIKEELVDVLANSAPPTAIGLLEVMVGVVESQFSGIPLPPLVALLPVLLLLLMPFV